MCEARAVGPFPERIRQRFEAFADALGGCVGARLRVLSAL